MDGSLDECFPVKPETPAYAVASVLVGRSEDTVTLVEVAAKTGLSTTDTAATLERFSDRGIITEEDGVYYIKSEQAERVKQRLKSVDAVVELFEAASDDDSYSKPGWTEDIPSINHEEAPTENVAHASKSAEATATKLIEELTSSSV